MQPMGPKTGDVARLVSAISNRLKASLHRPVGPQAAVLEPQGCNAVAMELYIYIYIYIWMTKFS